MAASSHETHPAGPAPGRADPSRWLGWLLGGVWPFVGLLLEFRNGLGAGGFDRIPFWRLLPWSLLPWVEWTFLAPAILWLGARLPPRLRRPHTLLVHLGAILAITTLHVTSWLLVDPTRAAELRGRGELRDFLIGNRAASYFPLDLAIYFTILLAGRAVQAYFEYRTRLRAAAEVESHVLAAEIDLLEVRLNPRLLFRSLDAAAAAMQTVPARAELLLELLSDHFHHTLAHLGRHQVELRDELEAVRCVVALENARLGDRIELRVLVPEELLQAMLPGSSLLPLFEMLLDEPPEGGTTTIEIAARRREDRLEVELRFCDAAGPARSRPALLGERAARLAAVQQRLQRLPGGRVDLVSDNGATGARLVVPFRAPDTAASPDSADFGAAAPDAAEPGLDRVEAGAAPEPTLPWALLLGAAPLFTLVAASVPVLAEQALGRAFPWSSLGWGLLDSLSVTALVPAVVHAAILYPVESPRRAHNLLILVSVTLACATLPQVLSMSAFPGTMPEGASRSLTAIVPRALDSRGGLLNILFYAAIGLGVLAFGWGRKASERAAGAARLRARLAEMRLQVLRMQIHPHFLFNTLNAIAGLLGVDAGAARRMTAELQEFLRLCLGQEARQTVALRDELHFLETYVRIEEARFGDRLQVDVDVDPAVLDAEVPSLILQPLVENAVRHGIAPRREGGRVEVRARDEAGVLHLRVADSGAGRDPARRVREGVGLSNTRARLRQLYGGRQSLELGCAPGGGFVVDVRLPIVHPAALEASRR